MTPNAFFLQLALFIIGNLMVKAFVHKRICKRHSVNPDFVFPDQLEFVSRSSPFDLRQAPATSYDRYQRTFSQNGFPEDDTDVDDGHQYRTQFTLRRAKPFGETRPRKPLTSGKESGGNTQNEILFPQEGSSSDQSPNFLTSQASHYLTQAPRNPATSQSSPTAPSSQTYSYPSRKPSQQAAGYPGGNNAKSTTLPPAGASMNCRDENRPYGSQASDSFEQTHSTSVISSVGVKHSKPLQSDSSNAPNLPNAPNRPFASQTGATSGLYFGTSETFAFRSSFDDGEDDSGDDDDFLFPVPDLVKHPFLRKLSDVYSGQYKTVVNIQHSSSSSFSHRSSSGFGSSSSNFPKIFPAFSSSSNFASSIGFPGGVSSSAIGKAYFFQR